MEKVKDPYLAEVFQARVGGKLATLQVLNADVDKLANNLIEVLHATAEEDLGRQRKKIQPLITNEVLDPCHQRLQLKQ